MERFFDGENLKEREQSVSLPSQRDPFTDTHSYSSTMDQIAHSAQQSSPASSELPIFWLGEVVFLTLTKGVENFCDALHKVMRRWSNDFVVRRLLKLMVILNPRLSNHQQTQLVIILSRAVDQLLWERSLDPRVMRGIVGLACPNQDTGLLFGYLMEVIAGLACTTGHEEECVDSNCTSSDLESPSPSLQSFVEEAKVAETLAHHYCVEPVYVAAMPPIVKKAVLGALNGGLDALPNNPNGLLVSSQQCPPICCITLEPLLCPDGTVTKDVVALIQRSYTIGNEHAFLYRGRALHDWLGHSQVPTNPETRSLVRPTDIYRIS